jgi:hypothetical protein
MPNKIAFLAPSFAAGSPAQHLLDRCLAGYPHDGAFRPRMAPAITAFAPQGASDELLRRSRDLGLALAPDLAGALTGADAALVAWPGSGHAADITLLEAVLRQLPADAPCFVHGLVATHREDATRLIDLAASRKVRLFAATSLATAPRLPQVELRPGTAVAESLVVVQGADADALLDGTEALHPDLERARVIFDLPLVIRAFQGEAVWAAAQRGQWSMELLGAALSRSNTPQGDAVTDGRTQDLLENGLHRTLARNPRAWLTVHPDGSRSAILALDGVVTDVNFALRTRKGAILSTQVFRPPAPNRAEFHPLAAAIDDFFNDRDIPWSDRRALSIATWHAALRGERGVKD